MYCKQVNSNNRSIYKKAQQQSLAVLLEWMEWHNRDFVDYLLASECDIMWGGAHGVWDASLHWIALGLQSDLTNSCHVEEFFEEDYYIV